MHVTYSHTQYDIMLSHMRGRAEIGNSAHASAASAAQNIGFAKAFTSTMRSTTPHRRKLLARRHNST
jgi:hypothetical protein